MDDAVVAQWSRSGRAAERIASAFAREIASGRIARWQPLPLNAVTADDYNVSTRTVVRAKQLLAGQGAARKVNGIYVATGARGKKSLVPTEEIRR